MDDIILEYKGYNSFNLIFQDFTTDIKLSLEKSDLEQLRDKINNILDDYTVDEIEEEKQCQI